MLTDRFKIGNAYEKRPQPGVRARSSRGASAQIGNKSSGTSNTPTMAYSRSTQARPTKTLLCQLTCG